MINSLDLIMDIGEHMLIYGAEVHRVEDSIQRMCKSLGARRADVFIITSSMVVTICSNDGSSHTRTRRIEYITVDLEKLHLLNSLSRKICENKIDIYDAQKEYQRILQTKSYPLWMEFICYAVIAGAFTLFFGGNLTEALFSLLLGGTVRGITYLAEIGVKNKILIKFICSFAATALTFCGVKLGLLNAMDKVIIGNIMTLIPGIGLTNSLRDLFAGDSIASILRFIDAVLTALGIAGGYFLFIVLVGGVPQ